MIVLRYGSGLAVYLALLCSMTLAQSDVQSASDDALLASLTGALALPSSGLTGISTIGPNLNKAIPTGPKRFRAKKKARMCQYFASLGQSCGTSTINCCATGQFCKDNQCVRYCPRESLEGWCTTDVDCTGDLGYVCYQNRCLPPAGAQYVMTNDACDQGTQNTSFCLPGKSVCTGGICAECMQ